MLHGKKYFFRVKHGESDAVEVGENEITVFTYDETDRRYAEKLLENFYRNSAVRLFSRLNAETYDKFKVKYNVPNANVKIKLMKTQWGNCHVTDGYIVINFRLMFYPEEAAEYVFTHEYAHFVTADHSKKFYGVVADIMPDYKDKEKLLK